MANNTALRLDFFKSMRFRISAIIMVIFLVISLAGNYFINFYIVGELEDIDAKDLMGKARAMLNKVQASPLRTFQSEQGTYHRVAQTGNPEYANELSKSPDFPQFDLLPPADGVYEIDTFRVAVITDNISEPGQEYIVHLVRSAWPLRKRKRNMTLYLMGISLLGVALSGFAVYWVMGRVIRPMTEIIHRSKDINAAESMQLLPVPNSQDEVQLLAETINDMLKRIGETITNQNNFFASAAHELRTPLTVMQTEVEVALQIEGQQDRKLLLQSQLAEILRLRRLVQDFLLVSQLKTNTLSMRIAKDSIDEVIYEAAKKIKAVFNEYNADLKIFIHPFMRNFEVEGDVDKLVTVIINLLENAAKYSPKGSSISLSLREDESAKNFTIEVENPTLAPVEDVDKLFEEFYQQNVFSNGLGLGLWISQQILDLHHGTLALKQVGDKFKATVTLPASISE